ncbi:hypothetical protein [Agromyces bracchium]|uniref:Uncharacterized protein n=1 Tax=Agromyces bracchium TaxID=88376 RepID=A0A6I3M6C8_9MICO|nr:hypothetical protein [Agromyces bracchium]MTH68501.1 hypothetical protein [Agromyces bracchium]
MVDEGDRGRALAVAVAERVTAKYPATSVEIRDGGGFHGTVATFTPRNPGGAPLVLLAAYDWSFDIHAGRFILFDTEPMEGSEPEQVDLIVEAILEVAREGVSRGFFDRLISFGRDRVGPWSK